MSLIIDLSRKTPYIKYSLGNLLHVLQKIWKQMRYVILAEILTVEVPFCLWVHHLGMFSSGVIMLLILNAVLPPRFLVRNIPNRVTCTYKPSSHTVSFLVWKLPCRSISCPKTLQNEPTLLYASKTCYSDTLS